MIGAPMASLLAPAPDRERGVRRVATVWRLFRAERDDPAPFYRLLAAELVDDLERRVRLDHAEILRVVGHAEPLGSA